MIDLPEIKHHIQKHILAVLYRQRYARFRDLRPPRVETNLYSYHLKLLIKQQMVDKTPDGYTLSNAGLQYVDRVSGSGFSVRSQPKIITMLVIQNSDGDLLLQQRIKQPHIDRWSLPHGKLHITDRSAEDAARREAREKLGVDIALRHAGDCYIRQINGDAAVLSSTLAHIFYAETDQVEVGDKFIWVRPHKLASYQLAPAVEEVVARTFFRDSYFFEEFTEQVEP